MLETGAEDAEHLQLLRGLGLKSWVGVPLRAGDQVLGALSLVAAESGRVYGAAEVAFAEELASHAGLALHNAALFRRVQAELRTRDDFLSAVSHDLRSPLSSVAGATQVVLREMDRSDGARPERLHAAAAVMRTGVDQMGKMIDSLLDAARVQLGRRLDLDLQTVELTRLVEEVVAEQRMRLPEREIALLSEEPLLGEWDAVRLRRVFSNLIDNAIKYSREGTRVVVRIARDPASQQALVIVRDAGIGIPSEDLTEVFNRFRRGGNVVGQIQGAGIGLAVASQVVEQHGGTITVESQEGVGSVFTVRLPVLLPDLVSSLQIAGEQDA
jgi:signal transduction histidine kinase